ncbi:MAG TPA: hypothetical protein P5543_10470 [Planctomycetota bacterium]|nr:hypothetical protein [Planctomycetota bacterium]HRU52601.1 hypothetical protein [Planctomycetota bacterium]
MFGRLSLFILIILPSFCCCQILENKFITPEEAVEVERFLKILDYPSLIQKIREDFAIHCGDVFWSHKENLATDEQGKVIMSPKTKELLMKEKQKIMQIIQENLLFDTMKKELGNVFVNFFSIDEIHELNYIFSNPSAQKFLKLGNDTALKDIMEQKLKNLGDEIEQFHQFLKEELD